MQCPGVAIEVHTCLLQNSQAGRLNKKMSLLTLPTDSTLGGESLSSVRKSAISNNSGTYPKKIKQTSLLCTNNNGMITTMPLAEMERVYKVQVEAALYHHKPLDCLIDPMVIAALTIQHPSMKSLSPKKQLQSIRSMLYLLTLQLQLSLPSILVFCLGWQPCHLMV